MDTITIKVDPSGKGDFTTINDALDSVEAVNDNIPVRIELAPGEYYERLEIIRPAEHTGTHVKRVALYTDIICKGLGMSDEESWKVSQASKMHDVGKIIVPLEILEKPGKLTPEEFEIVKKHTDYGKKMLENSPGELMQLGAIIAYQHHERWDGTGYHGMKGEEIHPAARCVALADVFDALVSRRPYKEVWSLEKVKEEIAAQRGKQFAPDVVDVFLREFDKFEKICESVKPYDTENEL